MAGGVVLGVSTTGDYCFKDVFVIPIFSIVNINHSLFMVHYLGEPALQVLNGADVKKLRPHIESLGGKVNVLSICLVVVFLCLSLELCELFELH